MKTFKITKNSQYIQSIQLDKGKYTYSCNVKSDATVLTIAFQNTMGVWTDFEIPILSGMWNKKAKLTFDLKEKMVNFDLCKYASNESKVYVQVPMLEEGTNASTPKSSNLDDLEGIDNNKSQIKAFNQTFEDLENYIDGAFKDGVIDSAEAKAIEKYKNTINEAMARAEASYLKVYANTYLEDTAFNTPKSDLADAKINLWGQSDILLTTIDTAIADGKTTVAEKNAVDSAFNLFNNLVSAFQSALEEANKAIQVKLDDISRGRVDNLEFGGRNLFILKDYNPTPRGGLAQYQYIDVEIGQKYTASTNIPISASGVYDSWFDNESVDASSSVNGFANGEPRTIIATESRIHITVRDTTFVDQIKNGEYWIKLEKGNKATDWTPAPEDVQDAIDKAQADAILARAVTDKFGTTIDGGLVQTVMMLLREANTLIETAGISGIQGENGEQPFLWGGGTYAQALKFKTFLEQVESGTPPTKDALPNFVANHNGAVKLGKAIFNSLGQMVILDKDTGMALLIIDDNEIPSKAEVLSSVPKDISRDNEQGYAPYDGVYMFPDALETTATGGKLIVTGTIKFLGTIFAEPDGAGYQGKINLYKDDIYFSTLYTGGVTHKGGYDKDINQTISLNKTIHDLPKGTYTLGIEGHGYSSNVAFSLETSKMRWIYDGVNNKIHIGSNGIMAYFGDKLLHYTDVDGLTVRGPVDMPPPPEAPQDVLCTQRLAHDGYEYEHTGIPLTCSRISTGKYRVVHNIGHYHYVLTCASMTAMTSYHISLHDGTTCEIEWRNASGDLTDTDFRFTIIGRSKI